MSCIENADRKKRIDAVVFMVLFAAYTAVMFILFYRQAFGNEQYYHSDMSYYILEMQGLNTKYSFPYPVFFKLGALFYLFLGSPGLCVALAAAVLNSLSAVFLKYYMDKSLAGKSPLLSTAAVFSILFVSMLYLPGGYYLPGLRFKYVGTFTPNPFHNATYMATRPFAVVCFFMFAHILTRYEKETDWKENVLFGVFLFLTTMTKPSFTFVLVPVAGLIMLYRLFRDRFRSFAKAVKLGVCFIPTFCALLYQYMGVFSSAGGGEGGIGFGIASVWSQYSGNILFSVLLAAAFPLLVLILHGREWKKDAMYRLSWLLFFMSFFQALCLYEKGFRMPDFNFSWGYMHGLFFLFVSSVIVLIRETVTRRSKWWILAPEWLAYAAHVVCGIWYFRGIFLGNQYY